VVRALDLVKKYAGSKLRTYPLEEDVPLDGVVRSLCSFLYPKKVSFKKI
jgi:hypothetical protein